MYKVLLTDSITLQALKVFEAYPEIDALRTDTLEPKRLAEIIPAYDAIVVRSPTRLTAEMLAKADRLWFIGRAGVGTDNIDLQAATELGIVVMNSPRGNTISTAEHTIGMILSLSRRIPHAHRSVTSGEWDRRTYRGVELYQKTLGIVGLGVVGREVAKRMLAFGMEVIATDPFLDTKEAASLSIELVSLQTLLRQSDVITIHVPLQPETKGMISEAEINEMRDGVILVNCARGGIVDEAALIRALQTEKVSAAGLDVFEIEPPGNTPLFEHPRSVFTSHIGGATLEAQVRVATDVAQAVAQALTNSILRNAVNMPANPRWSRDG
jgi:D-3-phosphoglycerate dehydrogenase